MPDISRETFARVQGIFMDNASGRFFAEARRLIPGGVNSPVRACRNVDSEPLFIVRAAGCRLTDADNREYIDFVLSWGPMLLGHAEASVTAALHAAVERGASYGAPCPDEVALAREICAAVPGVEMVRMVNSGTEAAMSALRLARGVTGRNKIVKCAGCYHGHADPFLAEAGSGVATLAIPGTPGIPCAVTADTLLVPYNDIPAARKCFATHGQQIAAAIVEPVAGNMGLVPPVPGFLETLRSLTGAHGALLIFDEVITGFRAAYSGAQARFGIDPDLTVLGKIIGGGLPVGAFGGKKQYMEQVAPEGQVYQAGTLSGNPLAMAAGLATLRKLKTLDYGALEKRTHDFAAELGQIIRAKGVPVQTPSLASMFGIFFSEREIRNLEDARQCDPRRFTTFYKQMRDQGVYLAPSAFETGMVSFAHADADLAESLDAARAVTFSR
jgi:glutamate-1-semialdehyde 2,1-aminomutase